ncbi:hypothetical protein AVEN_220019-1 [Araneus ventricosus]|uniref:Mos1 transposase HTH domain-containing protein n=1 Tax=Araneus ventricosus TaxID=182803 RepID=A0A4Y2CQD1_ARAVE|nr:hypothetical protein AVEN_220019-1 [Araneus ventricosus]
MTTPELPLSSPNFRTKRAGRHLAPTYDLACNGPACAADLRWNQVSNLEPFVPEEKTLPLGFPSARKKEVYGEQCLVRCTIFRWCQRYEVGRINTKDLPRPWQAHVMTYSATISAVYELIRQNRRITTREIAVELSISNGTMHHIIHKKLGYGKVCAQWVPKHLSENQKTATVGVCLTQEFLY